MSKTFFFRTIETPHFVDTLETMDRFSTGDVKMCEILLIPPICPRKKIKIGQISRVFEFMATVESL